VFPKERGSKYLSMDSILGKNCLSHIATALVVVPTMIIAATVPDSFAIATDIAVSVHDNMWHPRFLR
jgi:tyrosine-specific transport protein